MSAVTARTVHPPVPFLDLSESHAGIADAILADFSALIESSAFTNGPAVAKFEEAFAAFCEAGHCVGVASGLDALRLGLLAGGLERGDEVIVPAMTFVATLEAVTQSGGRPVVADVSEQDYGLHPDAAAAAATPRTRFLLPVHLYGQMADVDGLLAVANGMGSGVLEDACQAHGAARGDMVAGSCGTAAAFSFYPGKNLGAMGDAGALVTRDSSLAEQARALREHGQRRKYRHDVEGYTARLDTIQAIVLLRKLPLLTAWNDERRLIARLYSDALAGVGDLVLPPTAPGSDPVWHLYVVRTGDPDRLGGFLHSRGIATGRHYPDPVHLCPAYTWLGYRRGAFPVAERLAAEALSLPVFPGMTESQVGAVVDAIIDYFAHG
jgi:dTDP-4-amino-4,6-dideoxygalactose transaminase